MSLSSPKASRNISLSKLSAQGRLQPAEQAPPPRFENSPSQRLVQEERSITTSDAADKQRMAFQPFFALVDDVNTSEHHHPTVHYVFADDDPEIVTETACWALAQDSLQHNHSPHDEDRQVLSLVEDIREHSILLDVEPSQTGHGYKVSKAHSLSPEWQVLDASISNAPTIDRNATEVGEGLMLKIEGTGPLAMGKWSDLGRREETETLQQLVQRFQRGMTEIRKMRFIKREE